MSKRTIVAWSIVLVCCLLAMAYGVRARLAISYTVNWDVVGGGGDSIGATTHAVDSTVGQGVIGAASSANYRAGLGYWYLAGAPVPPPVYKSYLPGIFRRHPGSGE